MTWDARHISIPIARDPQTVIAFAGNPENLPLWAAGLSSGIARDGDDWVSESPMGKVRVSFRGPIELGLLDHDVTLPDGAVVHNPLRVLPNDDGSEVVFTLFSRPDMTADEVERDAELIREDLTRLQTLLEGQGVASD